MGARFVARGASRAVLLPLAVIGAPRSPMPIEYRLPVAVGAGEERSILLAGLNTAGRRPSVIEPEPRATTPRPCCAISAPRCDVADEPGGGNAHHRWSASPS
jgi:hypothetical protein